MTEFSGTMGLLEEQEEIRAKCYHPSGSFVEFKKQEIEQSIPERFEKIVRMYPDRIAVKTKDSALTYEALNNTANHVGQRVLTEAEEGNVSVALLLERGFVGLAAILGILKAGKIYVPLDPSYPVSRLRYMLRDAQAGLIVTNYQNLPLAREITGDQLRIINVDDINTYLPAQNLGLSLSPSFFAYILYTSGSTGQPKGVVENHRNVLHGTLRFTNGLHITAEDRLSFTHSFSSSASVRRIFPALLNGASLFPLDVKTAGMHGLVDLLVREEITYCSLGRIRDFVRTLSDRQRFDSIRLVSFGGETVYRRDVELCRKMFPPDCLVGVWMSTTETGNITQYFIGRETAFPGDIVPIGYPAADMTVLLLDDSGNQVEPGEVGEIAVQSRYLSPGYWRRPELNDAKFLPDPEGSEERIYLTGDMGRMGSDGCLFHLGRKDDQVKIRGHRVELAETEAALLKVREIKRAFVTVRERSPGDKHLIGYIVPEVVPAPTTTALRRALGTHLPDYMIPSVFVVLDSLPLTPTGKVDRRALPAPGNKRPELDTRLVAPRTPVENEVAQIWAEVLGLDEVGIQDDFFDLGGHSLAAAQVVSRIFKSFELELPIQSLFQAPTVEEMAAILTEGQAEKLGREDLARILTELDLLSEQQAREVVARETKGN